VVAVRVRPARGEVLGKSRRRDPDGLLGFASKVSDLGQGGDQVIVVYTANWHDQEDVRRALRALRQLGWTGSLSYKRDEETSSDSYGRGSTYYVSPRDDELEVPMTVRTPASHDAQRGSEGQCSNCFLFVPAHTISRAGRCQDCA
jgi:hypothetical protein